MDTVEMEQGTMRLFASRTGAKDIVTIEGSVYGGSHLLPQEKRPAHRLMAGLLDSDTKKHGKEALRNALSERGVTLSFSGGGDRTYFSATCLPEHVRFVCDTIAECLSEALFKRTELESERALALAELKESETDTRSQAARALSRLLFDPGHINYDETTATVAERTKRIERADLVKAQRMLGQGGLICALVGDIHPDEALRIASTSFTKLPEGMLQLPEKKRNSLAPAAKQALIRIPDKANIDVFIGTSVPITLNHDLYVPLYFLTNMLGGGGLFLGHLMRTIRVRDGLTYGIYARLCGFTEGADGMLRIQATFSPATFEKAVAATKKEMREFFRSGIGTESLLAHKDNLTGSYAVSLSTSRGLANMLHKIGREGKPLSYISEYPSLIRAVTLEDLQAASALIDLDTFSLAAAGTFDKETAR